MSWEGTVQEPPLSSSTSLHLAFSQDVGLAVGFDLHFLSDTDIELLLMYLLAICMSSLEKCSLKSLVRFPIGYYFFCN